MEILPFRDFPELTCTQTIEFTPGGQGSSPIFERGCATWGSRTPPFDKAHQRRNFVPVLRQILEKVSKKCLKMYDSLDFLSENFTFEVAWQNMHFLGVKLQFSAKKGPVRDLSENPPPPPPGIIKLTFNQSMGP